MMRASDPVVLASAVRPSSRRTEARRRVTVDFPLVPVTVMRRGMALRFRPTHTRSTAR